MARGRVDAATRAMIRTAADETAVREGCRFDLARAERVRTFFPKFLRHSEGPFAGKPFELAPWEWDGVVKPLYGWIRPDDRGGWKRRFDFALVGIPKKCGKTTLGAGLGLYHFIADGEAGPLVLPTAVTKEQAGLVQECAYNMARASPAFRSILEFQKATRGLRYPAKNGVFRSLAHDANSTHGPNASLVIMDEWHAWKGNAGRDFFETIQYAGAARRQPLTLAITTAGDDVDTVCYERWQYAREILSGRESRDTSFFAFICEATPEDDLDSPEVWARVIPSLGITIDPGQFARELARAKTSPTAWTAFKRLRFNVWTAGSSPAISRDDWLACRRDFDAATLKGRRCWGGLDLARKRDMSAFALVFEGDAFGEYFLRVWFWMPRASVQDPRFPADIRALAEAGRIRLTEKTVTDFRVVEDDVVEICNEFRPISIAFDEHYAEEVTSAIASRTGVERVAFEQTMRLFAAPTAEFDRLILSHSLHHDGDPVLTWQVGHVEFATDRNLNARPVKPADPSKKVDGVVAAIMAIGLELAERGKEAPGCGFLD